MLTSQEFVRAGAAWPPGHDVVSLLMLAPTTASTLNGGQWTVLVQQARQAGLLARLAQRLLDACPTAPWPAAVAGHFESALRLSQAQQSEIAREVRFLVQALQDLAVPVVLLKGAAYAMAGLPAATGRVFGDIDILVPKAALDRVEAQLMLHGWMGTQQSSYDQRYYRQWMHELPPMQHVHRQTMLDVHHTILPETARLHPNPAKLFARAVPLPGHAAMHVLAPEDMVLHSMTHLFLNDNMTYALRDLSDLDLLLRSFGASADFWAELPRRAAELDLARPLYYGLRHASRLMGTPIPGDALVAADACAPRRGLDVLMDTIWSRALRSQHASAHPAGYTAALWALYLRGHWLRMPLPLLTRHLATKAWMRLHRTPPGDAEAAP